MTFPIFDRIDPREIQIRKRELQLLRARRKAKSRTAIKPEISGVLYIEKNQDTNFDGHNTHPKTLNGRMSSTIPLLSHRALANSDVSRNSNKIVDKKRKRGRKKGIKRRRSYTKNSSVPFKDRRHSSKYTGVSYQKKARKWTARLTKPGSGRKEYLGLFETEEEAALKVLQMAQQWGKELRSFVKI